MAEIQRRIARLNPLRHPDAFDRLFAEYADLARRAMPPRTGTVRGAGAGA